VGGAPLAAEQRALLARFHDRSVGSFLRLFRQLVKVFRFELELFQDVFDAERSIVRVLLVPGQCRILPLAHSRKCHKSLRSSWLSTVPHLSGPPESGNDSARHASRLAVCSGGEMIELRLQRLEALVDQCESGVELAAAQFDTREPLFQFDRLRERVRFVRFVASVADGTASA
jgi:hypothetical protein